MAKMKKKGLLWLCILLVVAAVGYGVWAKWMSPTRIAFVNYQTITLGQIGKANSSSFIEIESLGLKELDRVTEFDMVFINGMGIKIVAEQRAMLEQAGEEGLAILTTMVTNPANDINTLDSIEDATLKAYIYNAGRENFHSMLSYVRRRVDGKTLFVDEPKPPVESAEGLLHHPNMDNPDDDDVLFTSVREYVDYLKKHGLYREGAKGVVVTGPMGDPTEVIKALEESGNNVYAVSQIPPFVKGGHADSVQLNAVINVAHGRMGDYMVQYIASRNIPLFSPLNVNRLRDQWEKDKMGMSGGFLSQSVVTPEIDGALRSYALFANGVDGQGLQYVMAMPDRLDKFVSTVNQYLALQSKPNSEKKVAIYYYKGPGQNAMVAAALEVAPSLYELLKSLKQQGYKVDGLPGSSKELEALIQREGRVLGAYATGVVEEYLKNGNPALVSPEQYAEWTGKAMNEDMRKSLDEKNGLFPGFYMATPEGKLAVARVQLGNVVLMPQYAAGGGKNEFKVVHGTNEAPPHIYVASYLWSRYGFGADVLMHFGTHGSLEFTPHKQVALSGYDWPDVLVGTTPHLYIYTIGNVGEGIIAKRRSYAGLQSHLTAPFMETKLRGKYRELGESIKIYYNCMEGDDKPGMEKASLAVKKIAVKLGIHRELELDSVLSQPYTEEDINRIENFAEELATAKINGQMYTLGIPYREERIASSVEAMATDPIAFALFAVDRARGKADASELKHMSRFTRKYLDPAKQEVLKLYNQPSPKVEAEILRLTGLSEAELAKAAKDYELIASAEGGMPGFMLEMFGLEKKKRPTPLNPVADKGAEQPSAKSAGHPGRGGAKPSGHPGMGGAKASGHPGMGEAKPSGHPGMGEAKPSGHPARMPRGMKGQMPKGMGKMGGKPQQDTVALPTPQEKDLALAVMDLRDALSMVYTYRMQLQQSPQIELQSIANGLKGGYVKPSPGGDPIANPNTLPTGRNLYSINAEATPSESAWDKGKRLADNTLAIYRRRHHDSVPRKVSYTLWSGEFIETEGATVAQVLYMLGVQPIWDRFGRVSDLKLIPSEELGRPRIDVVVQTSGQLRDLAASRLFLISRAVEMAANAKDEKFENQVKDGVVESEKRLIDKGLSPQKARAMATRRVFGGVNGNYGTGIQGMVFNSAQWEKREQIADTYLNNMGAFYGSEEDWEAFEQFAFEAALTRTDVVVQPRQSNTWGALSLDHVFEFMGGLNLAVRNVTGKEPDAYLSDYRNRHRVRMQEVKEAIGVEGRTTIFNPAYIKEQMRGEATSADGFAAILQNTFGWEVMKPDVIDDEMWDEIYRVYVKDGFNLGVHEFFEKQNPAALEEMTAVMLESARKGMWKASADKIAETAKLHTQLVDKYKPSCSGFVCNNPKLRDYIAKNAPAELAKDYDKQIEQVRNESVKDGMVMKKEQLNAETKTTTNWLNTSLVLIGALVLLIAVVFIARKNKKRRAI